MSTALLICMENTFWNFRKDGNFVELFKKTFTLYVESEMKKKTEADIDDILQNDGGEFPLTKNFKTQFCKIIIEHYLRKFLLFSIFANHI
jgi:hypothetical protein